MPRLLTTTDRISAREAWVKTLPNAIKVDIDGVTDEMGQGYAYCLNSGKWAYLVFRGKAAKPSAHYAAGSQDSAIMAVKKALESIAASAKIRQSWKAARKLKARNFKGQIGDVMYRSFGYDQTHVNFYQIVGFAGAQTVLLVPIPGKDADVTGTLTSSYVKPAPLSDIQLAEIDLESDKILRCRATDTDSVKVDKRYYARLTGKDDAHYISWD